MGSRHGDKCLGAELRTESSGGMGLDASVGAPDGFSILPDCQKRSVQPILKIASVPACTDASHDAHEPIPRLTKVERVRQEQSRE